MFSIVYVIKVMSAAVHCTLLIHNELPDIRLTQIHKFNTSLYITKQTLHCILLVC